MKVILKFNYDDEAFGLIKDNKKFRIGKIKDKNIDFVLSSDEFLLAKSVLNNICLNNQKFVQNLVVNDHEVGVYFDSWKHFFSFENAGDNELVKLNNFFNHQSGVVYFENKDNRLKEYINLFVNVNKKWISVLILASMSLSFVPDALADVKLQEVEQNLVMDDKLIYVKETVFLDAVFDELMEIEINDGRNDNVVNLINSLIDNGTDEKYIIDSIGLSEEDFLKYKKKNELINKIKKELLSLDVKNVDGLKQVIKYNPYIGEKEKEIFIQSMDVVSDNLEYIDLKHLQDVFTNIQVIVSSNKMSGLDGSYDINRNVMKFFSANSIEDVRRSVVTHELNHVIRNDVLSKNPFLEEGCNVIFNNEYFSNGDINYDIGYIEEVNVVKMLIEIIGSEKFREYHFNLDENIIKEALLDVIDDEDLVNELFTKLVMYSKYKTYSVFHYNNEVSIDVNSILKDIKNICVVYYESKYERKAEDDLIMVSYMDEEMFLDEVSKKYGLNRSSVLVTGNKYYINSNKTNEYNGILVTDKKESNVSNWLINDDNRYMESNRSR